MSEKVYTDYVEDMIRSAELILEFTEDISFDSFSKDLKTGYAVIRCFEVMGEAASFHRMWKPTRRFYCDFVSLVEASRLSGSFRLSARGALAPSGRPQALPQRFVRRNIDVKYRNGHGWTLRTICKFLIRMLDSR